MAKSAAKDIKKQTPISKDYVIEDLQDHDANVAEIAYQKAKIRGFNPGYELDDWLEAEQELNLNKVNGAKHRSIHLSLN